MQNGSISMNCLVQILLPVYVQRRKNHRYPQRYLTFYSFFVQLKSVSDMILFLVLFFSYSHCFFSSSDSAFWYSFVSASYSSSAYSAYWYASSLKTALAFSPLASHKSLNNLPLVGSIST